MTNFAHFTILKHLNVRYSLQNNLIGSVLIYRTKTHDTEI